MVDRALIEASPLLTVSAPAQTSVGTTAGLVLPANDKRKGFWIQNTGITTIKLTFGLTQPTQTVYHVALKAGSGADDGSGVAYLEAGWVGPVNAISSGAGGTCVITEVMTGSVNWNLAGDYGTNLGG